MTADRNLKVTVVGGGPRFLSGMTYYTWKVISALDRVGCRVSGILMRSLIPRRLYPGKTRVGLGLADLEFPPGVPIFDGVDWWWGRSIVRSTRLLVRERPDVVLFQWWTGAVLHTYAALAIVARLLGSKVILEFHESQDVGEAQKPAVDRYVKVGIPVLLKCASGFVYHSEFDENLITTTYKLKALPQAIIPHGPYDQYQSVATNPRRECSVNDFNILFFGVIRPFKGLEDLICAFDALELGTVSGAWLTIVGETWEGWTSPNELIRTSRYTDRITFRNQYVSDAELGEWLAGADLVVLPYKRSSASGPLHTAMSHGLPVITTSVGGLIEAANQYEGATLVPPSDPQALNKALVTEISRGRDRRYTDPHSWDVTVGRYFALFDQILKGAPVETMSGTG